MIQMVSLSFGPGILAGTVDRTHWLWEHQPGNMESAAMFTRTGRPLNGRSIDTFITVRSSARPISARFARRVICVSTNAPQIREQDGTRIRPAPCLTEQRRTLKLEPAT